MLRSWNLKLQLSRPSSQALYLQIAQRIIQDIQTGRLLPGTVMPGSRELADSLDVNRKTVVLAYDELIAQGWLVTENRRGTFVSLKLPHSVSANNEHNRPSSEEFQFTPPTCNVYPFEPQSLGRNAIDFSDGAPDVRLIPFEILSRAFRRSLVLTTRTNHRGASDPRGKTELRTAIASMLNMEKGLHVTVDDICTVNGSQMGVFIVARALIRLNDHVIFEELTSPSAREAFRSCGAKILHAGVDELGVKVEEVENLCRTYPIRAIFITPQYQFPTTSVLEDERRKRLLRLAELYNFMIMEYDHDFDFSENAAFPLASIERSRRVIYIGSLSRIFAPALNIGYLTGPPEFMDRCAAEVVLMDQQSNSAIELAISELMHSGEVKRQMLKVAKICNERREVFQNLLLEELGSWADFNIPKGGSGFWLRFRKEIDMPRLIQDAVSQKIRFSPGSLFSEDNKNINAIRLGFTNLNINELTDGVARLRQVLNRLAEIKDDA